MSTTTTLTTTLTTTTTTDHILKLVVLILNTTIENVTLSEEVDSGAITSDVEVFGDAPPRLESQFGHVVPSVISEKYPPTGLQVTA